MFSAATERGMWAGSGGTTGLSTWRLLWETVHIEVAFSPKAVGSRSVVGKPVQAYSTGVLWFLLRE